MKNFSLKIHLFHFESESESEPIDSLSRIFPFFKIKLNIKPLMTTYLVKLGNQNLVIQIGNQKDGVCLHLHGQVSRQPKRCRSAMLDPKGRAFCYVSGSLLLVKVFAYCLFNLIAFNLKNIHTNFFFHFLALSIRKIRHIQ